MISILKHVDGASPVVVILCMVFISSSAEQLLRSLISGIDFNCIVAVDYSLECERPDNCRDCRRSLFSGVQEEGSSGVTGRFYAYFRSVVLMVGANSAVQKG